MSLSNKLEDWQEVSRILENVNKTRGHEQRMYLDQYIEKKQIYQLKYKESYHPKRKPE